MADVLVKFYENFHQVESATGVALNFLTGYLDGEGVLHHVFEVRVIADGGSYQLGVVSTDYNISEEEETRYTGALAFNADGPTIAAALNAIGETILGGQYVWTFVGDGPHGPTLDVEAAFVGSEQSLPEGYQNDSTGLSGHLEWDWDEIEYEVDLTKGGCGGPNLNGEIKPGETEGGSRPVKKPISGQRA